MKKTLRAITHDQRRRFLSILGLGLLLTGLNLSTVRVQALPTIQVNCTQIAHSFQSSPSPTVPYSVDGAANGKSYHCIQYLQQMINARDAFVMISNQSAATLNRAPVSSLTDGAQFYSVGNHFGEVSGTFNSGMQQGVTRLQEWDNAPTLLYTERYFHMSAATFGVAFRPYGALPSNGAVRNSEIY